MKKHILAVLLVAVLVSSAAALSSSKKHKPSAGGGGSKFDYYLLSLSWAPNFCAGHPSDQTSECKVGAHTAFVLHGLWPQSNAGQPPMACKAASPVSSSVVKHMREFMPTNALIQHEWEKHGTCSGLSSAGYFAKVEQAFTAVKVPDDYKNLSHSQKLSVKDVEQNFATANNAPVEAFRISCHAGDLVSVEACLDKDLKYQACTRSVRECPSGQVQMRPTK